MVCQEVGVEKRVPCVRLRLRLRPREYGRMGLDVVELVMRCEESFGIGLDEDRLGSVQTVGDLFELICAQLDCSDGLQPINQSPDTHAIATVEGWTRDAVWAELVQICGDQLEVAPNEITYTSRFKDDLDDLIDGIAL